ncbi:DEP domain-containing protein 7-like [Diretmus argenteus]
MASVKQIGAALNLAEKLCVRPQAHGSMSKPVQSSCLWSGVISHLRSSVKVKCRRVNLKAHSDCFLGSEAVDVVADHIARTKGFEGANVSRDRVVCVCQALLDCKVFEAVGTKVFGKDKKMDVFQDSKSCLYRFLRSQTPSIDELERGSLVHGIQKLFCSPSDRQEKQEFSSPGQSIQTCTSVKPNQLEIPASAIMGSLSPSRVQTDSMLPQSLVDEVWQEQTMLRLLKLVELPLLDGVLQCSQTPTSPSASPRLLVHSNPDLIYTNNHLDRQILKAFRDSQEDKWLCAALDCLDFLPDQPVVELSRELPRCFPEDQDGWGSGTQDGGKPASADVGDYQSSGLTQCKLLLYGCLVKHYSHTDRSPLLPQHMTDVYTAITDLLVNAKPDKALEALQLCLKLLPPSGREELRRLLTFMALAADLQGVKLEREMENRLAVKRSFSRAVLHSRALSKEKEDLMLVFMLSNIQEVFKIPGALHKVVSDKLASIVQGKPPDVTGSTFCQRVSSRTCADSTKKTTNQELWALLKNIHLDPKVSAKEKKRLLGQFYRGHPEIFNQYFGESAVTVL